MKKFLNDKELSVGDIIKDINKVENVLKKHKYQPEPAECTHCGGDAPFYYNTQSKKDWHTYGFYNKDSEDSPVPLKRWDGHIVDFYFRKDKKNKIFPPGHNQIINTIKKVVSTVKIISIKYD